MIEIALIGAGRLGTNLGYALKKRGYSIKAISDKIISSAKQSAEFINQGKPFKDNIKAASYGKLIFICVPDREIENICKELSSSSLNFDDKYVFHCSGLLSSEVLYPLKKRGAHVASFHPIQSFAKKKPSENKFKDIYFGLEGDKEAISLAIKIVKDLGGKYIILSKENKTLYHTACTVASNFLVLLLDMALEFLKKINLPKELSLNLILPLVKGTLDNIEKSGVEESLTGPLIRGDVESVKAHLNAIKGTPDEYEIYKQFSLWALKSYKSKLKQEQFNLLRDLLLHK
jgi:predicted short-subunit dehydrogenase-like oxidoreductase (DUF2520 family)